MFERIKGITAKPDTKTIQLGEMTEEEAHSLLTSIASKEGVFGIEWIKTQHKSERHLFIPQFNSHFLKQRVYKIVLPTDIDYNVFTVISTKSSCFPFRLDFTKNIMDALERYVKIQGEILFCQMILQKQEGNWKEQYLQQYGDYLKGINPHFVTSNSIFRSVQFKIMDYVKSKEDWISIDENPEIIGIEQKLSEIGFKTCLRFVIYGNKEQTTRVAKQIELILREMDYANNWRLTKDIHRSSSLEQVILRKFPLMQSEQILCMSEVMPFFCERKVATEQKPLMIEPVVQDELPVRLSFKLPSLSHLPRGNADNLEQDMLKEESIINGVLERIGLLKGEKVKVIDVVSVATVRKSTFTLPSVLNFSAFNETVQKNIKSHLGKNVAVTMGNQPNTVSISIPLEKRQKVYLRNLIDTDEFRKFSKESQLPIVFGVDVDGNLIFACLSKLPHLLLAGATNSGKSVWLNCVILTLLLTKTPEELSIYIIDPKQVEFLQFEEFPHVQNVITDAEDALELLESLTEEMTRRYSMFKKEGCRNISQYNTKSSKMLKYLICIIDEFSELVMANSKVKESVMRLGQLARACGIHVIVGTQRPSVEIIDGDIKAQLPARTVFKCASRHDYSTVLDTKIPYELLGRGDGACFGIDGVDGLTRFQGALIADNEDETDAVIQKVLKEWKDILKGVYVEQDELPEVKQQSIPTPLERAKFLICEEGKVTVRSLAKCLGIRSENTKEIFDELVKENWLEEPINNRSGYQVKISAEEIESFGIWFRENFDSEFLKTS